VNDKVVKGQLLEELSDLQDTVQQTLSRLRFEACLDRKKIPISLRGTNPTLKRTHYLKRGITKGNRREPKAVPFLAGKMSNKAPDPGIKWGEYDHKLDGVTVIYQSMGFTLQRKGAEVEVTKVEKA
jgi:hypothetical protein